MIAHIKGMLLYKSFDQAIVDVNGIGYQVYIPLTTFYQLPEVYDPVSLNTCTLLKDNTIEIYGFITAEEREVFKSLIGISGIGPRLARNILSGISVDELWMAIKRRDAARLSSIPGVGRKTAERLVVELADRIKGVMEAQPDEEIKGVFKDVVSALVNLGYKPSEAEGAVERVRKEVGEDEGFEVIFKKALKVLSREGASPL